MTGHDYRRYRFTKRTYRNQDLGPFINHEMNRCIQCYRCVRFYRDYAGGRDFDVFGCHDDVYFGRHDRRRAGERVLRQLGRGLPDRRLHRQDLKRHYTRKWDLQTSPSVCVHCARRLQHASRASATAMLRRIRNRYHHQVNGYFLCDRGRFGYEFVNSPERVRAPLVRRAQGRRPGADRRGRRRQAAGELCARAIAHHRHRLAARVARGELRAAHAGRRGAFLSRRLASASGGCWLALSTLARRPGAHAASVHDVETADAAFVLGEDVTQRRAPARAGAASARAASADGDRRRARHSALERRRGAEERSSTSAVRCSSPRPARRGSTRSRPRPSSRARRAGAARLCGGARDRSRGARGRAAATTCARWRGGSPRRSSGGQAADRRRRHHRRQRGAARRRRRTSPGR